MPYVQCITFHKLYIMLHYALEQFPHRLYMALYKFCIFLLLLLLLEEQMKQPYLVTYMNNIPDILS